MEWLDIGLAGAAAIAAAFGFVMEYRRDGERAARLAAAEDRIDELEGAVGEMQAWRDRVTRAW